MAHTHPIRPTHLALPLIAALILLTAPAWGATLGRSPDEGLAGVAAGVTGLQSDAAGVSFMLEVPAVSVDEHGAVSAEGLTDSITTPGAPALPVYRTLIALPPGADVKVTVTESGVESTAVAAVAPVASAVGVQAEAGESFINTRQIETTLVADAAIYEVEAAFPASLYDISAPGYLRDIRLVQLTLYPVRYNAATGTLHHSQQLAVSAVFEDDPAVVWRPSTAGLDTFERVAAALVLNYDASRGWRSLPAAAGGTNILLPVGIDTFAIEVDADGLYEVDYGALSVAGMNVNVVNPHTFQIIHRGQSVAYQFVGDGDANFEPGEKVRFYGWAFDGPRLEKQYVTNNVFWIWAGGAADLVAQGSNPGGYTVKSTFVETLTAEPENVWFTTWTDDWALFPNEPDSMFWAKMEKGAQATLTQGFDITLHDPATSGTAEFTVEVNSGENPVINSITQAHEVNTILASNPAYTATLSWFGKQNVNIVRSLPASQLANGTNTVDVEVATTSDLVNKALIYVNRLTFEYPRQTEAVSDQLIVRDNGGQREYQIGNFNVNNANNIYIWDITDRYQPAIIPVSGGDISGGPGNYTYRVGVNHPSGDAAVLATNNNAVKAPLAITKYTPVDIEPAGGSADWVAIAYSDFMASLNALAAYRQTPAGGGLATHIVDIADVINQYGYGLPTPGAIQSYIGHAFADWTQPPGYLLLVGDASSNPRQLTLSNVGNGDPVYMPVDLAFVDRFQGQIPIDTTMSLIVGGDYYPDLAVGRLPADSVDAVDDMVEKVLVYEQNQLNPAQWMQHILFVSDDPDAGGNFCLENNIAASQLPSHLSITELCLPVSATSQDTIDLRAAMSNIVNDLSGNTSVPILNYRGHGSISKWGGGGNEAILSGDAQKSWWTNDSKPLVLLSADCLDGYFTHPDVDSLGESFYRLGPRTQGDSLIRGTAAHWSSSGLGFSSEHSVLHSGFYEGLYEQGLTAIGDAVTFAKVHYFDTGHHVSELLAFTLLGDPAMQMFRQDLKLNKVADHSTASVGSQIEFTLTVDNAGIYAPQVVVNDQLPPELSFVTASASVNFTTMVSGDTVSVTLTDPMVWQSTATVRITALVDGPVPGSGIVTNTATAVGNGAEAVVGDETDTALVELLTNSYVFVPAIFQK